MPTVTSANGVERWATWARLAYVGVILLATMSGLHPDLHGGRVVERLQGAFDLAIRGMDVVDAARNLALFAGWGAVWIATAPGPRLPRPRSEGRRSVAPS
jgi:hypothetical protein